jgi:pimeloyl-ACP methyl ester carboxylesterase
VRPDLTIVCLAGVGGSAFEWDAAAPLLGRLGHVATTLPAAGRIALVGHSQGGIGALRSAASDPARVEAVVLTSSFFPPARADRPLAVAALDFARHRALYAREVVARRRRPSPTRRGAGQLRSMLPLALRPQRFHGLAEAVRCPVLAVHGDADHLVPVAFARAGCARHPAWTYRELAGAGHHPHRDRAPDWAALVCAWLDPILTAADGR